MFAADCSDISEFVDAIFVKPATAPTVFNDDAEDVDEVNTPSPEI